MIGQLPEYCNGNERNSEFDHFPHAVLNTVDTEVGL